MNDVRKIERLMLEEGKIREERKRELIVFGVEREKALLYVAIIETISVIILRIERQYKQFPYITT